MSGTLFANGILLLDDGFSRADLRLKELRHRQALPEELASTLGPVAAASTIAAAWFAGASTERNSSASDRDRNRKSCLNQLRNGCVF